MEDRSWFSSIEMSKAEGLIIPCMVAAVHQQATFLAMDTIVKKAVSGAENVVKDGESVARLVTIITILGITLGVVLALVLGFYLTFIITKPLSKGVELSRAMASGDMTQTMNVDQKDEIGVLAKSLNEMAANLRKMITDVSQGIESVNNSSTQRAAVQIKCRQVLMTPPIVQVKWLLLKK